MNEFWIDIPNNWGYYQISNLQNVRALRGKKIMLQKLTRNGPTVKLFCVKTEKYKTFKISYPNVPLIDKSGLLFDFGKCSLCFLRNQTLKICKSLKIYFWELPKVCYVEFLSLLDLLGLLLLLSNIRKTASILLIQSVRFSKKVYGGVL
jgi:hypothetical protein